jgi:hypothetical protein
MGRFGHAAAIESLQIDSAEFQVGLPQVKEAELEPRVLGCFQAQLLRHREIERSGAGGQLRGGEVAPGLLVAVAGDDLDPNHRCLGPARPADFAAEAQPIDAARQAPERTIQKAPGARSAPHRHGTIGAARADPPKGEAREHRRIGSPAANAGRAAAGCRPWEGERGIDLIPQASPQIRFLTRHRSGFDVYRARCRMISGK